MSRKATTMMSGDPQTVISSATSGNSPGIITNTSGMLPEEMWQEIFQYLEYRDFLNLKIASKHFNAIATRVAKTKYKWYELCRKKVPERHWCKILESAKHPVKDQINCENFHDEREFATIWRFLYSTWIGWLAMVDKEPDVQEFAFNNQDVGHLRDISVDGNIIAVYYHHQDVIRYYDILQIAAESIYSIPCPRYLYSNAVAKKGTDLTATLVRGNTDGMKIEKWNVKSQELIYSTSMRQTLHFFVRESFGYWCTITIHSEREREFCSVEIRQASSGNSQCIRFQLAYDEFVAAVQAHGNTLMLLRAQENEGLVKLHKISIRECQLKETHETSMNTRWFGDFFVFQPCVVVHCNYCDGSDDTTIGFSVSGREWKIYSTTRDLNLEAPVFSDTVVYEGGVLALLMETGNVQLIYVADPNDLDSKLETLPSRIVRLNCDNIFVRPMEDGVPIRDVGYAKMWFTKYNSKIYLIITLSLGAIVLEF